MRDPNESPTRNIEDPFNAYHLGPVEETTQHEYSISPTFSMSPGNYRYNHVATLTHQLAGTALYHSQDPQSKGKGTDSYTGMNHPF
jgi:hypothetical protein